MAKKGLKDQRVILRLPRGQREQVETAAAATGHTVSGWVRWVLNRAVAGAEAGGPARRHAERPVAAWELE